MSVRYDPILARALAREITARWAGASIETLRMDRGRRAVELAFGDGSRLVALLHPLHGHLYALDPEAPEAGIEGVALRVGRLSLSRAEAPSDERALLLTFADRLGRPWEALGIELQTQRWNAVHLARIGEDEGDGRGEASEHVAHAVWKIETPLIARDTGERRLRRGVPYALPRSTRRGVDAPPSVAEWTASVADVPDIDVRRAVLQTWAWTSTLNVDWVLGAYGSEFDAQAAFERYLELRAVVDAAPLPAPEVWLHDRRWGPQAYPHPLGLDEAASSGLLRSAAAVVEASGGAAALLASIRTAAEIETDDEAKALGKRLRSRRKRHAKRLAALERQLSGAGAPDEPRAIGQLLLARKDAIERGATSVQLEDFDGSVRDVRLDPTRDVVGNAEAYFDEARRRERALSRLPVDIYEAKERLEALETRLRQLEESGPSAELWDLVGGKPVSGRGRGPARSTGETRLPYTRLMSSGALEIRVGRGARDNDELTFHHSAPDDIWMHASQSSGAHVVLRWGRKDENPPRRDLLEAATAAAVHSGARHSGTVAVVWTRRKHVRKPRKSPPGTVVPNQVETLFVKPDERLVKSLRERAHRPPS